MVVMHVCTFTETGFTPRSISTTSLCIDRGQTGTLYLGKNKPHLLTFSGRANQPDKMAAQTASTTRMVAPTAAGIQHARCGGGVTSTRIRTCMRPCPAFHIGIALNLFWLRTGRKPFPAACACHKIALICTGLLLHVLSWPPPLSSRYGCVLR